jgi:TRAP-type C4-dicarboxylate transport system permease small subunit
MRIVLEKLLKFVDETLPALLVAFIIVMVAADILLRNIAGLTVPNGIELSTYAFVWLVFLGAAGASRTGRHFQVEMIQGRLSERANQVLDVVIQTFCAVVAGIMANTAWQYTMRSWNRTSEGLEMPLGYFYLVFPVSFALMALAHAVRAWLRLRHGGGRP